MDEVSGFHPGKASYESATRRAPVGIGVGVVDEICLVESSLCPGLGRHGLRYIGRDAGFIAGQNVITIEITPVGNDLKLQCLEGRLGLLGHLDQLTPVRANVSDLVCDDQVVPGIHGRLHVVADKATTGTGSHGARIRVGPGYLSARRLLQSGLHGLEVLHLLLQVLDLLVQVRRFGFGDV